jgi:hypothetical protein
VATCFSKTLPHPRNENISPTERNQNCYVYALKGTFCAEYYETIINYPFQVILGAVMEAIDACQFPLCSSYSWTQCMPVKFNYILLTRRLGIWRLIRKLNKSRSIGGIKVKWGICMHKCNIIVSPM